MISYKGVYINSFGLPTAGYNYKNRVKQRNRKRKFYHIAFSSPFNKDSPKNLILMYDIAEEKKKERDWLRRQLKNFKFIMIQRSEWVGPSQLPKEFIKYILITTI